MLQKDPRWDIVASGKDYETFLKSLPIFYLTNDAPEMIHKEIEIARKILEHSYFVYEFIDVGFVQLVICFEKVLKLRHEQLVPKREPPPKGKRWLRFQELIDWAFNAGLLEASNPKRSHAFRDIRNGKMHAAKFSLGGFLYLSKTDEPIFYINDLYEDPILRVNRQALKKSLQEKLTMILREHGLMWQTIDDVNQARVVVDVDTIFVNNKHKLPIYSVVIAHAFDLQYYEAGKSHIPPHEEIIFDDFQVGSDGSLNLSMKGRKLGTLRPANDVEGVFCKIWQSRFDKLGIEGKMKFTTLHFEVEKIYKMRLLDFYREN